MAKKIKFNKINGNDTIANSIKTLNQNFELLEDTLETQISKGVSSLQVDDVEWNTSGANGPTSQIKLSNGAIAKIKPIPSADESQSGVVTIGEQTIAGVKTFKNGILTDIITDKKHHNIIVADGNTVYVGGNGGIKLIYDNNGNLSGVEYGFLKGVDLSQIVTQGNDFAKALESLRNQIDGKISTFYGEGLPPSTQEGLSAYWKDANENHINDEYKDIRSTDNGGGKTYIFVAKTSETIITESDVEISEINYYWKGIDSSNISNIISQLEEAYNNVLAEMDGVIQIFGEADLPYEYNYGDIWFFGGIDKIQLPNKDDYDLSSLSSFVVGNIYYCEGVYGGSEKGFTTFNPIHWKVGSNAGDTTQKFAHMTSDDWLSVTEKQQLLDDWYEITGVNLSEVTNVNTLIQTINAKQNNRSSYSTTIQKYNEIIEEYNSHTDNGGDVGGGNTSGGDVGGGDVSVKPAEPTSLENSLKDIYEILVACGCREYVLSDSDLRELNIPSGLSQNYGTGKFSSKPTILSDVFNRYYAEEKNLIVELTDLQVVNTVTTDPITVKELAEGVGGRGFVLSSLIQLEYNNTVIGGLDGVTEDGNGGFDNVGMWFGGTVENAKKTLNGTLNDESPVPVIITKNGINSKIGPFKIGNSTTNEHIYIGDNTTGNTTVIGKDYISMGATYVNSNTKENAQQNSMIYLDKDGEGSRIGPLKIKKDSNNKILTFGNTTQVYSFKNTNDYTVSLGTRTEKTIDGYTFLNNELNKAVQYGTTIEDFKNIPVAPKDNFDHEMLPSMPRP